MLKMIGYWDHSQERKDSFTKRRYIKKSVQEYSKFPDPNDYIDPDFWLEITNYGSRDGIPYGDLEREHIATYLDENPKCNHYMGYSYCRICGINLGSYERTDGTYIWPVDLSHYIRYHEIRLPMEFIKHVQTNRNKTIRDYETDSWIKMMNDIKDVN